MANSDSGRNTTRPHSAYQGQSLRPDTLPFESEPQSEPIASEDFLYHLSRGSELLMENQVEPAKEALELALSLQPRDVAGQGLLGVVYFRLGLYPRAIDIYQKIVAGCPDEVTPKVNLALCYLKTGQHPAARELLEDVVQREPLHQRAWAYLGLVFQFAHDFAKAHAAFERAAQPAMAERMLRAAEQSSVIEEESIASERWELRAAAEDAFSELTNKASPFIAAEPVPFDSEIRAGKWRATEPGEAGIPEPDRVPRRPSTPPPSVRPPPLPPIDGADWASNPARTHAEAHPFEHQGAQSCLREWLSERAPISVNSSVSRVDEKTILVDLSEPFAIRADSVSLVTPASVARREMRVLVRARGLLTEEPLGGPQVPIIGFVGPGRLLARTTLASLELFELDEESITVRTSALLGLSLSLSYESERLRFPRGVELDVVRISGRGTIALALGMLARAIPVDLGGLVVRISDIVGWTARVLPEPVDPAESPGHSRGFLALFGEGTAILG